MTTTDTTKLYGQMAATLTQRRAALVDELRRLDETLGHLAALIDPDSRTVDKPQPRKAKAVTTKEATADRRAALVDFLLKHGPCRPTAIRSRIGFTYKVKDLANDLQRLSESGRLKRHADGWGLAKLPPAPPAKKPAIATVAPVRADVVHEVVWRPGRDAQSLTGSAAGLGSTLSADAIVKR